MKSWTLVICLVVSQLVELGCGKRFDPAMVDPLMRRSSLDKNFMRFGRSSPSYEDKDDGEEDADKEDSFLRSMRGKDNNFMRFGRAKNDNYMRFGRGKQDSFMRFGRARNDNFMRFGRGKDNNFMRFGRGKQDNYMRFGRGREEDYMRFGRGKDNYMRFGRGKQDNFMRFGKGVNYGKTDSFMRLGRGKQENFMRFGRDLVPSENLLSDIERQNSDDTALRTTRGRQNNMIRFGKKSEEDALSELSLGQPTNPNENFLRIVRGKQDNFMRFGKSDVGKTSLQDIEESDASGKQTNLPSVVDDGYVSEIKIKPLDLIRLERPLNANGLIRYSDNSPPQTDESIQADELIPPRLKRSLQGYDQLYASGTHKDIEDHASVPLASLEEIQEVSMTPLHQDNYTRKKRSLVSYVTTPPPPGDSSVVDYISAKLRVQSSQPQYESSLLSAGLPNVIVGPEFSLLPNLDPPASMLRGRPGDKSFLRLG